ncbi:MAG: hypothetical protein R3C17_10195 [Planctomycetaceae bacterium]
MDRTTLRNVAFWAMAMTAVLELLLRGIYALIPLSISPLPDPSMVYSLLSAVGFMIAVLSKGSLLLFLGLVHYDLMTAQRLSEHARDYLIRDLTQPPQENTLNHG